MQGAGSLRYHAQDAFASFMTSKHVRAHQSVRVSIILIRVHVNSECWDLLGFTLLALGSPWCVQSTLLGGDAVFNVKTLTDKAPIDSNKCYTKVEKITTKPYLLCGTNTTQLPGPYIICSTICIPTTLDFFIVQV